MYLHEIIMIYNLFNQQELSAIVHCLWIIIGPNATDEDEQVIDELTKEWFDDNTPWKFHAQQQNPYDAHRLLKSISDGARQALENIFYAIASTGNNQDVKRRIAQTQLYLIDNA